MNMNMNFLNRLHLVLSEASELGIARITSWHPSGRKFIIHDKEEFASKIVSNIFEMPNISSFEKELSSYGFEREDLFSRGKYVTFYFHEHFCRDDPQACQNISQRTHEETLSRYARRKSPSKKLLDEYNDGTGLSLKDLLGQCEKTEDFHEHFCRDDPQACRDISHRTHEETPSRYARRKAPSKTLLGEYNVGTGVSLKDLLGECEKTEDKVNFASHKNTTAKNSQVATTPNVVNGRAVSPLLRIAEASLPNIVSSLSLNDSRASSNSFGTQTKTEGLQRTVSSSSTQEESMIQQISTNTILRSSWKRNILGSLGSTVNSTWDHTDKKCSRASSPSQKCIPPEHLLQASILANNSEVEDPQWPNILFEKIDEL